MKGNQKVIQRLNYLLADELTAINQYIVQSEICGNWGYHRLHDAVKKQAIDEMKHAEKLIERIIFLEGIPEVGVINKMRIGKTIEEQFKNDSASEKDAVKLYNNSIELAQQAGDQGTAELLRLILADEERHLDWLETQLEQIDQVNLQNYLSEQLA